MIRMIILLPFIFSSVAMAGSTFPWVFDGTSLKGLRQNLNLNDNWNLLTGDSDPTISAPNATKGSIYCRTGTSGGACYVKQDNGSSTNWATTAVPQTGLLIVSKSGNDSNCNGSLQLPCVTIDKAQSFASNANVSNPYSILVFPGNYIEGVNFNFHQWVNIEGTDPNTVLVQRVDGSPIQVIWTGPGPNLLRLSHFTISAGGLAITRDPGCTSYDNELWTEFFSTFFGFAAPSSFSMTGSSFAGFPVDHAFFYNSNLLGDESIPNAFNGLSVQSHDSTLFGPIVTDVGQEGPSSPVPFGGLGAFNTTFANGLTMHGGVFVSATQGSGISGLVTIDGPQPFYVCGVESCPNPQNIFSLSLINGASAFQIFQWMNGATYVASTPSDWTQGNPGNLQSALDSLASNRLNIPVTAPTASNQIPTFVDTTGKTIQSSSTTIDSDGNMVVTGVNTGSTIHTVITPNTQTANPVSITTVSAGEYVHLNAAGQWEWPSYAGGGIKFNGTSGQTVTWDSGTGQMVFGSLSMEMSVPSWIQWSGSFFNADFQQGWSSTSNSMVFHVDSGGTGHYTGLSVEPSSARGDQFSVNDSTWRSSQTTSPTASVNANAGTGATCSVSNATNVAGNISLTTTAVAPGSGVQCAVVWAFQYLQPAICQLTPTNSNSATLAPTSGVFVTTDALNLYVNFANTDAVGHTYTWSYFCVDTQ